MNTKLDFVCDIIVGRSVNGSTELRRRPAAMRTESVGLIEAHAPSVAVCCARSTPVGPSATRHAHRFLRTARARHRNEFIEIFESIR